MARIKIDQSAAGITMKCLRCNAWHAFADTMGDAHDRASAHEQRVHPGEKHAQNARSYWRRTRRHAG